MSDGPVVSAAPAALKAARRRRAAARAVEGAAASAWPAASLCVLWAAGASSGLLGALPGPARAAAFLVPLLLLAILLLRSIRPRPSAAVLDAELEEDSDLPRGALSAAEDVLAVPASPLGGALWARRIEAAAARARGLRVILRPRLAAADPFGLRAVPILLFAVALAAPSGPAPGGLRTALDWSSPPPPAAEASGWIEPPEDLPSAAAELPAAALDPARPPADPFLALPFLPRPPPPPPLEIPEGARLSVVFKPLPRTVSI